MFKIDRRAVWFTIDKSRESCSTSDWNSVLCNAQNIVGLKVLIMSNLMNGSSKGKTSKKKTQGPDK